MKNVISEFLGCSLEEYCHAKDLNFDFERLKFANSRVKGGFEYNVFKGAKIKPHGKWLGILTGCKCSFCFEFCHADLKRTWALPGSDLPGKRSAARKGFLGCVGGSLFASLFWEFYTLEKPHAAYSKRVLYPID